MLVCFRPKTARLPVPTAQLQYTQRRVHARAAPLSDTISQLSVVSGLFGFSLSTLYLLRDVSTIDLTHHRVKSLDSEDDDDTRFIFTISSIISAVPFLSWLVRLS
jgi:hypothetical protein